jgi:hypothetical protein
MEIFSPFSFMLIMSRIVLFLFMALPFIEDLPAYKTADD